MLPIVWPARPFSSIIMPSQARCAGCVCAANRRNYIFLAFALDWVVFILIFYLVLVFYGYSLWAYLQKKKRDAAAIRAEILSL